MAEKKPANKPKRRVVKNPETFRERAVKAGEASGKPGSRARAADTGSKVFGPIATPFRRVFQLKPFRIIGKVLLPAYFRNSWHELRQVTWPSWKQSRQLTFAVLIFAIVFGALIATVDYGLDKLFRNILLK